MSNSSSSLPLRPSVQSSSARIHPTLEDLVRLQFEARDFSLLPRQPVHAHFVEDHQVSLR